MPYRFGMFSSNKVTFSIIRKLRKTGFLKIRKLDAKEGVAKSILAHCRASC